MTATYADRRQYSHDSPISKFVAFNHIVKLQNKLGQSETSVYNVYGHKASLTRYDNTVFSYTYNVLGQELTAKDLDNTTSKEWLLNGLLFQDD
jgi:C1A family cysteine protease